MKSKGEISSDYVGDWLEETRDAIRPQNRRAMVFGADPGNIGMAIANKLASEGYAVEMPRINATVESEVANIEADMWICDTLVCAVGLNEMAWFENSQDHLAVMEANLLAPYLLAQYFVNATIKKTGQIKTIVFIGSMAYNHVLNASAMYCASKAGLAHLTACLGWELAPKGYRVFCVHPSNVKDTPMTEATIRGIMDYRGVDRATAEAYWGAIKVLPDWLVDTDVAQTVSWLCSGNADALTGSQIEMRAGQR